MPHNHLPYFVLESFVVVQTGMQGIHIEDTMVNDLHGKHLNVRTTYFDFNIYNLMLDITDNMLCHSFLL